MDRKKQAQCKGCGVVYTFKSEKIPKATVCTCDSNQFKAFKQ